MMFLPFPWRVRCPYLRNVSSWAVSILAVCCLLSNSNACSLALEHDGQRREGVLTVRMSERCASYWQQRSARQVAPARPTGFFFVLVPTAPRPAKAMTSR